MKKILAFLLAMTMLLCLCACGSQPADNNSGDVTTTTEATTTTTTEGAADDTTTVAPTDDTTTGATDDTTTAAPTDTTGVVSDPTTGTTTQKPTEVKPTTTTTTTKAPTTTTTTTKVDNRPSIKILSIGHSFSRDAMDTYMADLFKAAGYNATFGYLYYPGASLERQYHYVKDDSVSYELYNKCVDGKWYEHGKAKATDALYDEDWDIVTFQPSPDYGKGTMASSCKWGCLEDPANDYVHFETLVGLVRNKLSTHGNKDVKFYWHLTWAFASDCKLWSFTFSGYNQTTMYWDFISATSKHVMKVPYIEKQYIPCITSIQNVRTTWMGDTFNEPGNYDPNADGYHLNDKGDLVAAMTWVAFFTGKSATEFKIATKYSDAQYAAFAEAVDNAIKSPMSITKSSYTTEP